MRVAEVDVDPLWRRLVGSFGCALLILPWLFGIDRLPRNADDVSAFVVFMAITWLITYRAWPAVEITWAFFTSPEARRAYAPTWPHVLGALGLSLGLVLGLAFLNALPRVMAGRESDIDLGALLRGVLLLTPIVYVFWPAIVMTWRRRVRGA